MKLFQNWSEESSISTHVVTRLFSLEPEGRGSMAVESLSGYISRLAVEHCMTTGKLFSEVFTDFLDKHYLNEISKRGGNGFFDSAHMINGNGPAAKQFSEMISSLTGAPDLTDLTLLRYRGTIPQRGLLKRIKTWCPECLQEMKHSQSGIVYERLIWNLGVVSLCREHKTNLMDRCPKCHRKSLVLDRRSIPGFCLHCRAWLGKKNGLSAVRDYEEEMKVEMIELLLENPATLRKRGIVTSLSRIVVNESSNSTELARKIGVPKTTFWTWINGRNAPSIIEVIRICNKFGSDIVDFYRGSPYGAHSPVIFHKRLKKQNVKLTTRPLYEVRKLAQHIIADTTSGHMHVQAMADAISCNKKTLYNHFPVLCKAQAVKRKQFLNNQRRNRIDKLNQEVNLAFSFINRRGLLPSKRGLERHLRRPAIFREREVRAHYHAVRIGGTR